jgi:ssRNA-specific RNase YbeY (16S rRNA maturation enzyme)
MIEVELFGASLAPGAPTLAEMRALCATVAKRMGVEQGHVAIEFVDARRMAELNGEYRRFRSTASRRRCRGSSAMW